MLCNNERNVRLIYESCLLKRPCACKRRTLLDKRTARSPAVSSAYDPPRHPHDTRRMQLCSTSGGLLLPQQTQHAIRRGIRLTPAGCTSAPEAEDSFPRRTARVSGCDPPQHPLDTRRLQRPFWVFAERNKEWVPTTPAGKLLSFTRPGPWKKGHGPPNHV
jgi:hypothetical protein